MKMWSSTFRFSFTAGSLLVIFLVSSGFSQHRTLEQSFQIRPGGTVEVTNPTGGVKIEIWDKSFVHIRAEKVHPAGEPVYFSDVTFAASESTIVVGCYPDDPGVRIDLTIYVPHGVRVQIGNDHAADQSPGFPPSTSAPASNAPGRPLPPPTANPPTSIAGDRQRGYDQQRDGVGPIQRGGDRKNSVGSSMGLGVRVIPPLSTGSDTTRARGPRSSSRDPFAVFDQDPFFTSDRDPFGRSKRRQHTQSGMGWPDVSRDEPAPPRSRPGWNAPGEPSPSNASRRAPAGPAAPPDDTLVLNGDLVTLNVSVRDRSGRAISGLAKSDFIVYEDGVRQEIAFFSPTSAPFNLVLVLDLSGSTREKLDVIKQAAIRFIETLSPEDRVAVVAFTREVYLISPLTRDRSLLRQRIEQIRSARGGTALYEAMWRVLSDVLAGTRGERNALVVLTDGVDNSISEFNLVPSTVSFDDLLYRIEESDVIIYPIYLDTEREVVYKYLAESPESYALARERLQAMAEVTGGVMFRAAHVRDLDRVYQQVASELRTVYSLGYYPTNNRRDGSWRRVRVKIKGRNVAVRTRAGYYAR